MEITSWYPELFVQVESQNQTHLKSCQIVWQSLLWLSQGQWYEWLEQSLHICKMSIRASWIVQHTIHASWLYAKDRVDCQNRRMAWSLGYQSFLGSLYIESNSGTNKWSELLTVLPRQSFWLDWKYSLTLWAPLPLGTKVKVHYDTMDLICSNLLDNAFLQVWWLLCCLANLLI